MASRETWKLWWRVMMYVVEDDEEAIYYWIWLSVDPIRATRVRPRRPHSGMAAERWR